MRRFVKRPAPLCLAFLSALGVFALTACGSSSDAALGGHVARDVDGGAGAGGGATLNIGASGGATFTAPNAGAGVAADAGSSAPTCNGGNCGAGTNSAGKPAMATCSAPSECESGRCEPVTGVAKEVCLGACFADGVRCDKALDCCSTGCHGGVCGGLCTVEGDSCKTNADCCSGKCDGGRCAVDLVNRDCRPTGEDCTSGSGRGCCNTCNKQTKRCDFGADTCFAEGVACTASSQCCRGACTAGVCKTPCAANGAACTAAGDCCSANCDATSTCAAKTPPPGTPPGMPQCSPTGTACTSGTTCCSGLCFGGFCEPPIE